MDRLREFFAYNRERDQYHSTPVPAAGRLGFKDPALVWSGFGIAYICAVIGGTIEVGLGMPNAIYAIVLGNIVLFVYSALIGYASGKWGFNFPLMVREAFGRGGAVVPMTILGVLVTGWYAFQAWLTADIVRVAFGLTDAALVGALAAVVGVIFALPAIFGIKWMANVMKFALPAILLVALYWVVFKIIPAGGRVINNPGTGTINFMTGVALAWSTFVVSGTMTGDIVRYTRTGGQAVGVTAVAFLFSNMPFMLLGAFTAAAINDPQVVYFFDSPALAVVVPLLIIAMLSNWSTCDACLYNATMAFTNVADKVTWRMAAVFGSVLGIVAAATGLIGNIVNWLILLGLIVPPIGGVIIADYYILRRSRGYGVRRATSHNAPALVALVVGIGAGYYVNQAFPEFLFGVAGIISAMVVYIGVARLLPQSARALQPATGTESEAPPAVAGAAE